MAKDTKERILTAALEMFSQKGYEGTFYWRRGLAEKGEADEEPDSAGGMILL